MRGISILDKSDSGDQLSFDLLDMLKEIKFEIANTTWKVECVECLGNASEDLHALSDSGEYIPGERLLELALEIYQVIDGEFYGYKKTTLSKPWIVIRAVDSSAFDVECEDTKVLDQYKKHFRNVIDIPE